MASFSVLSSFSEEEQKAHTLHPLPLQPLSLQKCLRRSTRIW
ncbi:hypothetical protein LINGRAHAP2_LOCUS30523 [Linum grandiflorum]